MRRNDFRVVIVYCRRAHHEFHVIRDVFRTMADCYRNTEFPQIMHILAFHCVRAGNQQSHTIQNLCQRRHGNSADSDQMSSSSG